MNPPLLIPCVFIAVYTSPRASIRLYNVEERFFVSSVTADEPHFQVVATDRNAAHFHFAELVEEDLVKQRDAIVDAERAARGELSLLRGGAL